MLTGVTTLAEVDKWKSSKSASDKKLIPDFTLDGIENLLTLIDKMDEIVLPKISSPKIEKIPPKKKRACVERNLVRKYLSVLLILFLSGSNFKCYISKKGQETHEKR